MIKKNISFWIFLVLSILLIDFGLGSAIKMLYSKQEKGIIGKLNHLTKDFKEDIIFMGSSKAEHAFMPDLIDSVCSTTSYNAGFAGKIIPFHYALLQMVLDQKKPSLVVLDVTDKDIWDLGKNEAFAEISTLSPFYGMNTKVDSLLEKQSIFEPFKLKLKCYPYNSQLTQIIKGSDKLNRGFKKNTKKWKEPLANNTRNYTMVDATRVQFLEQFILDCKSSKTQLIIVLSPVFMKSNQSEFDLVFDLAKKHKVEIFDYYQHEMFLNSANFFADKTHLNVQGAEVFSALIAEDIKKYLKPH